MIDLRTKLEILADAAKYDVSCASSGSYRKRKEKGTGNTEGMGICHSYTPDGRCISLLKLLLTNICIWDCSYCVNRRSSDIRRARFRPQEIVDLTINFYKRNYIEGLFLSSGIIRNADHTMELLIEVARKLREEENFGGYIHLKAAPGASAELLQQAGIYADRLSANIEMPLQSDLDMLAPDKTLVETERTMKTIRHKIDESRDAAKHQKHSSPFVPGGQSTQIVVGATATKDSSILIKAESLYREYRLRRVYYSAFSPAHFTDPQLSKTLVPTIREHRLYEADWLVRHYGFSADEIIATLDDGNLDLEKDPKLAWALKHREMFPVDVNRASRSMMLRVPGIGVKNVDRIIKMRRHRQVRFEDLVRLRISMNRAKWFIKTADHNAFVLELDSERLETQFEAKHPNHQLSLFDLTPSPLTVIAGEI
ncbi:putative DNA modification/repair radical SAM protein [Leptolyngbya sp. 7M]|uniref:putative DNA modification/repair radical SAM protein n=1 Tax=Leptolyngbya sp. 7M TaxID=2812896 RepID=UPI001B8B17D8|nr:putative DNA modification/repair radical SAM protein [Leptolyngbya sp. 7M]QYO67913.1 putative DNA modification/repair radical SAM protein [Leptolyngbya sp. 7M]